MSLPSRERGLKSPTIMYKTRYNKSLPSRERGLKWKNNIRLDKTQFVAPFAGAWIEIPKEQEQYPKYKVAPFAGAWIEILLD